MWVNPPRMTQLKFQNLAAVGGQTGVHNVHTSTIYPISPDCWNSLSRRWHLVLEDNPARAQVTTDPLKEHFHPKGKAPSKFTLDVLRQARGGLPFADTKDFEEQKKGFIAPMTDFKIMADAGHVAWDMDRFQFLEKQY